MLKSESSIISFDTRSDFPSVAELGQFAYAADTKITYFYDEDWVEVSPATWVNGVKKFNVKTHHVIGTVSSGQVVFDLTENAVPMFTEIFLASALFRVNDSDNDFTFKILSVASDKSSMTVEVKKIALSIGVLVFTSSANGVTVYLTIQGN